MRPRPADTPGVADPVVPGAQTPDPPPPPSDRSEEADLDLEVPAGERRSGEEAGHETPTPEPPD